MNSPAHVARALATHLVDGNIDAIVARYLFPVMASWVDHEVESVLLLDESAA